MSWSAMLGRKYVHIFFHRCFCLHSFISLCSISGLL
jgi:hypothetical protein